jgi:uncharacterized delta-60 repeat protein
VARLNADGTLDTTFNPGANNIVRSIAVQTDGRILLTGNFTTCGGASRSRIARLNADGTLDTTFTPGANGAVFGFQLLPDGRAVIMGEFTALGAFVRGGIALMETGTAAQSLTAPEPSAIRWMRSGALGETHDVTFDLSSNGGGTWTPLGRGTRIPGGWELTGIALPQSGTLRARARLYGSYASGTSGLEDITATYAFTAQEIWRFNYFGSIPANGDAANTADPDHDGCDNLTEYAFGLHPREPDASLLPQWEDDEGFKFIWIPKLPVGSGITIHAESSDTLAPGSWTALVDEGTAEAHLFYLPWLEGRRLFLRLRVTQN